MSRIVTFYSYKGGVGRTFILSNIAVLLARRGLRVLIMDWDLEAPGLDRYFRPWMKDPPPVEKGVLPMLRAAAANSASSWRNHVIKVTGLQENATLDLIPSGAADPRYAEHLQKFSWESFFSNDNGGSTLERWRDEWRGAGTDKKKGYDFVLIDSRTGLSDIGGVCTILLPDVLAAVFTASHQSAHGVRAVIDSAQKARQKLAVQRLPLTILPIPARFDGREEVELGEKWLNTFDEIFTPVISSWRPAGIPARRFFVKLKVPYVARFSFGEELAVETHGTDNPDLPGYSLSAIASLLAESFKNAEELVNSNGTSESGEEVDVSAFLVDGRFDLVKFEAHLAKVEQSQGRGENR